LFNSVIVGVDPSYSWTSAWASSTTITGFTALDNLLSRHGYSLTSFSSSSNYALLTTNKDLNTFAMSDSIELLMNGITYAEPNFLIGDGNRIDFKKSGDTLFYDFSLGWSDCPSGCINLYGWKFKVSYSKCEVTSMGGQFFNSWGSYPLPPTVNCNLTGIDRTNQEINVTVFPNPVSNFLQLNFSDNILKSEKISIVDVSGKTILKRNITSKENRIDVSMLKNGVYILLMEGKSNHSFKPIRFVKI
ncbi:MAG: T9SS type A sorting domain-containing protein, partial [Flavobacteriales bacterium]